LVVSSPQNLTLLVIKVSDLPETVHFTTAQEKYIENLRVTCQESAGIERRTVKRRECGEWVKYHINRLGSSVCHRIYIRKRSYQNLAKKLNKPFKPQDEMSQFEQKKLKHGITDVRASIMM